VAAVLDDNTLRLVRIFSVSRERVFDAFAVEEQFIQWMCPPGVEVDEVGDVQVLPQDPGLRIEGKDGWLGLGRRARRGEGRAAEDEEEQSRECRPCNGLTIIRSLRESKIEHSWTSSTTAPSRRLVR